MSPIPPCGSSSGQVVSHSGTVTPTRPARRVKSAPASASALRIASTVSAATVSPSSNRAHDMRLIEAAAAKSCNDHCSAARAIRDWVGVMVKLIVSIGGLRNPINTVTYRFT